MKISISILAVVFTLFVTGCSKQEKQTSEQKSGDNTVQMTGSEKSVEMHTSGMTCTGCEQTIKGKVKKVEGVKDVIADHKSNTVKASYDPAKTNPDAIKEAITAAGYKVESVK